MGGSLEVSAQEGVNGDGRRRTRKDCTSKGEDSRYILIDYGKGERLHLYIGQLGSRDGAVCMTGGAHHVVLLGPFPLCRETQKVNFLTWIARRGNCSHWRTTTLTRTGVFDTSKSILLISLLSMSFLCEHVAKSLLSPPRPPSKKRREVDLFRLKRAS